MELLTKLRLGDQRAAEIVFDDYRSAIERVIRIKLADQQRLKQQFDSADIYQSVMAEFFMRVALGQYELQSSTDLIRLLAEMSRNRVAYHARKNYAQKRDVRRRDAHGIDELNVSDGHATPSQIVANRDLLEQCRARLTDEERLLAEARSEGKTWEQLASELGEPADTLRKRLTRALDRVANELGFESIKL